MAVSDWAGVQSDWRDALEGLKQFIGPVFKRSEQRASAGTFIDGLLSGVEPRRVGCWRKRPGWRGLTGYNRCLADHRGRRMRSAIGSGGMLWTRLKIRVGSSSLMKPGS